MLRMEDTTTQCLSSRVITVIRQAVTDIHLHMRMQKREKDILSILICMMVIRLPSFEGEPKLVAIPDDMNAFTDLLWNSLNEDNKVSLFVRYIDIATGNYESKIVNKNK